MDTPQARATRGGSAPPARPQPPSNGRQPWVAWAEVVNGELASTNEAFATVDRLFNHYERRIEQLEARIAQLEKKPAARAVEHQRDSHGAVIRSILLETPAAE